MHPIIPSRLLLKWIAAHMLAITLVSMANFSLLSNSDQNMLGLLMLSGVISGLGIGGAEAWVLRSLLPKRAV